MIQLIGQHTLQALSAEAKTNPRLRKNLNFHANNEAQCHRLLNALEPGTYVQPHCHLAPEYLGWCLFQRPSKVYRRLVCCRMPLKVD